MADRYWVGGSGTWNTTSTTNWSATSGGAGGASVPTTADDVFFDQAGTYTVTMTGALNCRNFTVSAGAVTYATGTTPTLAVAGSMSLIAGTVWNSTGTITFSSTGAKSITSAGTVFACSITITGAGGTFTFNDNLTLNSARTFTLTNGTLNLGTYTLSTGIFSSANSNTRAINFSTGKIVLTGNTTSTIWDLGTSTNCTTSGSQLVEITGGGGSAVTKTISGGTTTSAANSVNISILDGAGTNYTFTNGHNIKSLIVAPSTGGVTINNNSITFFGSFTNTDFYGGAATFAAGTGTWIFQATSGLQTITTDGAIFDNPFTINAAGATYSLSDSFTTGSTRTFTLTAGNLNLNGFTLSAGIFSSNNSNSRSINFSNDGQIVLTGNNTTIFDTGVSATNFSTTGTPYIRSTYAGATGTRTFSSGVSLAQSSGYSVYTSGTTGIVIGTSATDTVAITGNYDDIDFTGLTNTISNTARTVYGNFTVPATGGSFTAGTNATTLIAPTVTIPTSNSVSFDGTGDYLTVFNDGNAFNFGSGNWTIEFWVNGLFDVGPVVALGQSGGANSAFSIFYDGTNLSLYTGSDGTNWIQRAPGFGLSAGWNHVAFVCSSGLYTAYLNGSAVANNTNISIPAIFNDTIHLLTVFSQYTSGGLLPNTTQDLGGSLSNLRIVKGTAVYTSNFTPPTSPLTAITGTSLLICQSASFVDNSINNFTVTSVGNASISSSNPFPPSVVPSTTTANTNGRLLDFPITVGDASGSGTVQLASALTLGSTRTLTLAGGTFELVSYTVTTGLFSSSNSVTRTIAFGTGKIVLTAATGTTIWNSSTTTNFTVSGTPLVECQGGGTGVTKTITPGSPAEANTISFSLLETSGTVTYNISTSNIRNLLINGSQTYALVGSTPTIYGSFTHLTTNGTTTITSTSGTFIFAATSDINTITTPAGFTYDFAWTFNGAGGTWQLQSNVTLGSTRTLTLTAGTLDLNNYTFTANILSSSNSNLRTLAFGTSGQLALTGNNATLVDFTTATNFTFSGTPYINSTYTGATGTRTFNFGGTAGASVDNVINVACTGTNGIVIGSTATDTVALTGAFDSVNLTGLSATLSNTVRTIYGDFIVPSTGGTLTAGTSTTTLVAPSLPVANGYSAFFDGSGDNLNTPNNAALTLAGGDFTLEAWVYTTGAGSFQTIIAKRGGAGREYQLWLDSGSRQLSCSDSSATNFISSQVVPLNTWSHVAVSVEGSGVNATARLFYNGTLVFTTTAFDNSTQRNQSVSIGSLMDGTQSFGGYISNVRITKGVALYTSNFTPATSPLTASANTSLLTCQNNTFVDNSGNNFPLTVSGSTSASTASPFATTPSTNTANTNGRLLDFPITVGDSVNSGTVQLASALTLGSTRTLTLGGGTFDLVSYTATTGLFNSSNAITRTLAFGTGKIVLNSATTSTVWTTATVTNLTVTGTPLVECIGGGTAVTKTINTGTLSEANSISFSLLETTGTATYAFTASNAVRNLTLNGVQTVSNIAITIYGDFTHLTSGGTTTLTAGANTWTFGSTSATLRTLLPAAVTYGFPWTFNGVGGSWQLNANLALSSTVAFTLANGTFDFDNFTVTGPTSGITINGGNTSMINTAGALTTTLPVTHTAGTLTLAQNFTTTSATGYTLTAGTLALGTYTLTTPAFASSNTNSRTLNFGTGKIVLNANTTSTIWNTGTVTGLTVTGSDPQVTCIGTNAATKTINTGALSEANSISFSFAETSGLSVTYSLTAGSAFRNLLLIGNQTISNTAITIYGSVIQNTGNGTTTLTGGTNAWTLANTGTSTATGFYGAYAPAGGTGIATVPASSNFEFSGDFTIEGWMFIGDKNNASPQSLIGMNPVSTWFDIRWFTTRWQVSFNSGSGTNMGGDVENNQWTHVAVVRSGSSVKLYINGVATGTTITNSSTLGYSTATLGIGFDGDTSNVLQQSYISNLRIVKGIAVYTGNFTVPTGPLTATQSAGTNISAITGNETVLLTLQNATFLDNSSSAATITAQSGGSPSVWNPFNQGGTGVSRAVLFTSTVDFPLTFNGVGGTWEIDRNLTMGGTRAFTLTNGTFDFNNFTLSGPTTGITINGGSTTIANTGGGGSFTTALPFTHTAGTLTLAINVTTTSTSGYTLSAGTLTLGSNNLTTRVFVSNTSSTRAIAFGTGKIVVNANTTLTVWNTSTTTGFSYTGTGLVEFSGGGSAVTKTINTGTLTAAQALNFSLIDTGGTPTYAFTASNAVRNLTVNGAQTISNIAITIFGNFLHQTTNGTTTFTAGANAWTFGATSGTQTITTPAVTYDFPWSFNGVGGTWQLQNNITLGSTRAFTLANGTFDFNNFTLSGPTSGITINGGSATIANTGGGGSLTTALPFTHTAGTFTLPFNVTTTGTSGYTFTAGTLALGSNTLTTPIFSSSNSNTRTINFGTGKIVLNRNATATIWDTATSTNLTTTGTPLVECQGGGTAVTKTINAGSGITEANTISFSLLETTGTVTYTISASSRIRNLLVNGVQTISNTGFDIFGSFTHLNTNGTTTFTAGTNILNFRATSGNHTINPLAGFTYDFPWQVGNATASTAVWTLTGNMALGATRIFYFAAGIFDFNTYMVTAGSQFYLSTGAMRLRNTGGATITTTLPVTIDASGGSLILEANFTTTAAGNAVTLTVGTLNLNDFVLTARVLSGTGSGIRSIAFGTSGQIAITGNAATVLEFSTMGNFTYTGNPYINLSYTGATGTRTMNMGTTSGATATNTFNVATSGTSGIVIGTAATDTVALAGYYNDINLTGLTNTISNTITFLYGNLTVPGTGGTFTAGSNPWTFISTASRTITTNSRTLDFPMTFNGVGGTWTLQDSLTLGSTRTVTLTAGTIGLNDFLLTASTLSSSNSNTRAINFGTTGQITLAGNAATIVDFATMTGFTYTGTPRIYSSYSGATGTRTFNIGGTAGATATNVFSVAIGTSGTGIVINAGTDSVALTGSYNNIDFTGLTQTVTNTVTNIYGGLTVPASGGSFTAGANTWSFLAPSGTSVINTNGRTLDFPITIGTSTSTGTAQLAGAVTMGSTRALTVTGGTLDLNNFTLTAGTLSSTNSNRRTLAFGSSGGITLAASTTTVVDMTIMTNFTRTGTPYINSTGTGARSYIFGSSGGAFPDNVFNVSRTGSSGLVIGTGIDSITLTGSFGDIDFTGLTQTITNTARTAYGNLTVPAASGTLTAGGAVTTVSAPATVVTDGYSIALNGSTDFLSLAGNSVFAIPTSTTPFTIECWVYPLANGGCIFSEQYTTGANSISIAISMSNGTDMDGGTNGRTVCFGWYTGAAWVTAAGANTALELSAWTHVACVFTGSTTKIYYNGVDVTKTATPTPSTTWGITNVNGDSWYIGRRWDATGTPYFNGYISNFRFTRGVAVYTENFTPSTSPLTTTSQGVSAIDVSLLTCQAPSFVDNSLNNLTVTRNGSASVAQRSPFSSTQTTKTITTNGRTLDFPVTIGDSISGPGITQMTGALTLGSTRSLTLTATTMDLNDFTATANAFSANGIVPRTLSFDNTGQLTLSGSNVTVISMPTATNFTMTGNNKIVSSYTGATGTRTFALGNAAGFTVAGNTEANNMFNFNINGTQGIVISGGTDTLAVVGQVRDFDLRGTTNIVTNQVLSVYGNFYTSASGGTINAGANTLTLSGYSGNFVIDTANRALDFPVTVNGNGNYSFANNYTLGTSVPAYTRPFTLTAGNLTLNNVTLFCNSFVSNSSSVRSLNFPGTTGAINLTANGTTVWNSNNGANFSTSGNIIINSTYTSNLGTRVFDFGNIAEASAPNVKITTGTVGFNIGTANDSVTLTGSIGDLNLTGLLATVTNTSRTVYGNITIPATGGTFTAGTTATVLGSTTGTKTIDTANRALAFPLTFNGVGGNWTLANGLNANATTVLTLANGSVDFNQKTLTFANITIAGGATGNASLSNLSTTLAFVHANGTLNILSGAINSATTNAYTLNSGTLNVSANFSTGAFTNNGGNIIL